MNNHWHEQIQRYVNGEASPEEVAALQAALSQDAAMRALFLDYMNLDVALGEAAEAATITENGIDGMIKFPDSPAQPSPHSWRWLAAAATACAALLLLAIVPRHRNPVWTRPDIAAACSSAQEAITRLSLEPTSPMPVWASPTASMLDQPRMPKWDL